VSGALDPSVRVLDLEVPAVGGVVRHLGAQVLTEADPRRVQADLLREQLGVGQTRGAP
jgi:hypothetical protein